MSLFGFGKSKIPFDMFNLARGAKEARRAERLANIYHRGQELAWDGRRILCGLMEKHGGIQVPADKVDALSRIFGVLMWGEMAAWKISAELADRLVPLEARLAATAQTHDEGRHFYVMHDYLSELGRVPTQLERAPRVLLDVVLETDDLRLKLIGMQLLIETIALTVFQAVRESKVEPVLCELLLYFEKDEARHVGLGLQQLPSMMAGMRRREAVRLLLNEMHIMGWAMAELKVIEDDLRTIGVDPRRVFTLGMAKQAIVFESLGAELGMGPSMEGELANRLMTSVGELLYPMGQERSQRSMSARLRAAVTTFRQGTVRDMPQTAIDPTAS